PKFLKHGPASYRNHRTRRVPSGEKSKAPSVSGGALEFSRLRRLSQRRHTSPSPHSGAIQRVRRYCEIRICISCTICVMPAEDISKVQRCVKKSRTGGND